MIETAPDRLTRMLAMVAYLRDNPAVPVAEVAEHFAITEDQVIADVNTLWVSGTPGYMHGDLIDFAGDDLDHGVLTLLDSREMDRPLRLSPGEAVALLVALQSLQGAALAPEDSALVEETIAVLRTAAGEAAQAADAVELVDRRREVDDRAARIREGLLAGRRLHLRYVSASDQTTERDVDPLQLLTDGERWFLVGWCHRAEGVRHFRVDRILEVQVLDAAADAHPDVRLTGRTEPDTARAEQVRLELASRARWFAEQLPDAHITELDDGWLELTVGVVDLAWLHNIVLALGPDVRAVEPASIAARLSATAQSALDAYAALERH
ncbi:helix-turn-helix transcriptional regulator [Pseudactinotalea sp.]|uniref:helix-turn-helix transcriptional regulator n=1 Tax=Pseudactinotalea sp. TaxID=1926260 RepID=UPI003B3B8917